MLLNCGVGEDSWESLGLQEDPTSQSKPLKGNHTWIFIGKTGAEAETPILWPPLPLWEELTHWEKKPWCWERLKAGGEGDERGWDGCTASPSIEFEQVLRGNKGQESLACYSLWDCK